jgi:hypothetical protein
MAILALIEIGPNLQSAIEVCAGVVLLVGIVYLFGKYAS